MTAVLLPLKFGHTRKPLQSTAPKENGVVLPTGQEIELGVMVKLVTAQQLVQPVPQVAVETL